jgi:iron complex outermembrane recepter protein
MGELSVTARALLVVAACAVSVATGGTPAHAQVTDTLRFRLDSLQIPVTRAAVDPERAPLALSLVGRDRIQDGRPTITLDESLAGVPGLIVNNRYNFSLGPRVVMRGLGARAAFGVRGVRVLVDGIPLTMPDGQTNLNNLDLGSAGAIHVLRGPASALFGNAAGGVIAVETEPAPGALSTEARVLVGDQGAGDGVTQLTRAQFKLAQSVGPASYLISASRLDADGFRNHSRVEQTLVNSRFGYELSRATRLSLVLNAMDMPIAQNPGSLPLDSARTDPRMAWPANVRTGASETTRQAQLGARLQHRFTNGRADVSVHGVRRTLENPLPFGVIDLRRRAGGVRTLFEYGFAAGTGRDAIRPTVTAGLDMEAQRDDRREYANQGGQPTGAARRDQQDRVTTVAPFAQLRLDRGPATLLTGARFDRVHFETVDRRDVEQKASGTRTLQAPSVMAGASYAAGPATLFANVATSFQTPTTTELINAPPAPGQPCCPAGFNQELEPQRALSAEAGVRGTVHGASIELLAYRMRVRDALVVFQVPTVEGRDFFRNAGRTRHQGIELSAQRRLARVFGVETSYTYTDVTFVDDGIASADFEGNRVPGIAPHQAYLAGTWSPRASSITAEVRHTSRQHTNDANTVRAPSYTIVDVRAQTNVTAGGVQVSPFVALNNLLDAQYYGALTVNAALARFYEPAPGFNVHLGAAVRTGGWRR